MSQTTKEEWDADTTDDDGKQFVYVFKVKIGIFLVTFIMTLSIANVKLQTYLKYLLRVYEHRKG